MTLRDRMRGGRTCLGIGTGCLLVGLAHLWGGGAAVAHDGGSNDAGISAVCAPLVGTHWTARAEAGYWSSVASSTDGSKLVAVSDHIHTSSDAGASWTRRAASPGRQEWRSVASSADGARLVAVAPCGAQALEGCGYIYASADAGSTWARRGPGPRAWRSVTSSADGQTVAAVIGDPFGQIRGPIYVSTDAGATWVARGPRRSWSSVAVSADGTKLVAAVSYPGGFIFASTDSGATWKPRGPWLPWTAVASSADGTKLVASAYSDFIYTSSDAGAHWRRRGSSHNWAAVASAADGNTLIAVAAGDRAFGNLGHLCTSTDSGVTWSEQLGKTGMEHWAGVAASADGTKLVAAEFLGPIYVSSGPTQARRAWDRAAQGEDALPTCEAPAPMPPPSQAPPADGGPSQACDDALLDAVGRTLHIRRLRGAQREVQASACAPDPEDKSRTIVVATLPCDDSGRCAGDAVVIVALLERRPLRVVASYQGRIGAAEIEDSDLRIQPTGYHLAQGASAFAIDAITRVAPRAPSEGWGAARTLYVREANRLRPVLSGLSPFYWRLVPRQGHPVEASAIEKVELRLVVQDTSSAGYRDLLLLGSATRDDGQPSGRAPFRLMLRYDGRRYPTGPLLGRFERWLDGKTPSR